MPKTVMSDTGNAVENENKARNQYKGDKKVLRQDEPNHNEIHDVKRTN